MKTKLAFIFILIFLMAISLAQAADWSAKNAIGIRGPLFIPYDNHWGPEPYRMGLTGSAFFKHGFTKSLVVDLSIGYATTYDDKNAKKDANLKFMKKDLAESKLTNIPIGLTVQYYFMPEKKINPYLLAGIGVDMWKIKPVTANWSDTSVTDLGIKGGLGINFWLSENISLDILGKITYDVANLSKPSVPVGQTDKGDWSKSKQRPFIGYIEPSIGLTYQFGKLVDTDGDGIPDKIDQCPDTPLGAMIDKLGCPLDSDGDGVYDGLDKCPGTPKGAVVDITGCPLDTDQDGIYDGIDKCPNTPKGCQIDAVGCPIDSDADGVCDGIDKCPNTIKGCKVDATGCPMDGDGDGVCDGLDKCPTTPAGTQVDVNGCPLNVKPPVQKITLNIKYKTGSYEPDKLSKEILDELVKTMMAYTGTKIQINGFTDNVGSDSSNQVLSEKRAQAVMQYLIDHGVPSDRMTARGYGENPQFFVGDNKTPDGKQLNRRVEIISVE